jgi:hypothetical protein
MAGFQPGFACCQCDGVTNQQIRYRRAPAMVPPKVVPALAEEINEI